MKFAYTREQSIIESCKRHPYKMKYKVGLDEVGHIVAMKIDILADSGGYAASSPFVTGDLRCRPRVLIVFLMSILMSKRSIPTTAIPRRCVVLARRRSSTRMNH